MITDKLYIVGINYKKTPIEVREKLSFSTEIIEQIYSDCQQLKLKEFVCLNTCNRTEFYFLVEEKVKLVDFLTILPEKIDEKYYYFSNSQEGLNHLISVASGLDSLVMGETEITGQMKQAFAYAFEKLWARGDMKKLYNYILTANKKIRNETQFDRGALSYASISMSIISQVFESLENRKVVILGNGNLAQSILIHLFKVELGEVWLAARDPKKVDEIKEKYDINYLSLENLSSTIVQADVIISCLSDCDKIITQPMLESEESFNNNDTKLFIDFGVPRNIEQSIGNIDGMYLYNVDHLKSIIDENLAKRKEKIVDAKEMCEELSVKFTDDYENDYLVDTIVSFRKHFEQIKSAEMNKFFTDKSFSEEQKEKVNRLVNVIGNKIMHTPTAVMKKKKDKKFLKVFKEFFNLSDE